MGTIAFILPVTVMAWCCAAENPTVPRGFDAAQKTTMQFRDGEPIESVTRIARDTQGRALLELDGAIVIMDPVERVVWFADQTGRAFRHEMSEHRVELAKRGRVPSAPMPDSPNEDLPTPETIERKDVEWNGFPAELNVTSVTAPPDATVSVEPQVVETEYLIATIDGMRVPIKMETRGPRWMPRLTMETTTFRHLVGEELDVVFSPHDEWIVVDDPSQLSERPTRTRFPMLPEAFFKDP
ncbi:MAG: hypothetical protein OXI79_07450 [Gammaproteobacteria bacterium]|nr:hypothetical protein [Gammaproteobacteria bacterium]